MITKTLRPAHVALATAVALALGTASAQAGELFLKADSSTLVVPGGPAAGIPMWTYSVCTDGTYASCTSLLESGGVSVPAGTLTIHLKNNLAEPTSLLMPAQPRLPGDVGFDVAPDPDHGGRVTSLATPVAAGGEATYVWSAPREGTFLLQSGTYVAKQVQMGLYGAVRIGTPVLASGVTIDHDDTLVFSEIDPALHGDGSLDPVTGAKAANATKTGYVPRYFLINGKAYDASAQVLPPSATATPIKAGETALLRLVNAGLESHVAQVLGADFAVVAEDGYRTPTAHVQNSVLLAAGKAIDVTFRPTVADGGYRLLDRRNRLSNGALTGGGMLARLDVIACPDGETCGSGGGGGGGTPVWAAPTALADAFTLSEGGGAQPAPGVLGNDTGNSNTGTAAVPLVAALDATVQPAHGTVALNADGSFTYTPTDPNAFTVAADSTTTCSHAIKGQDTFGYFAQDAQAANPGDAPLQAAAIASLTLAAVNDAPVTVAPDFYYSQSNDGSITVPAASGFLVNDTAAELDCDALVAADVTAVPGGPYYSGGAATNRFTFPDTLGAFSATVRLVDIGTLGYSTFTYAPQDASGLKGATGTVYAVRDILVNTLASRYNRSTTANVANRWIVNVAGRNLGGGVYNLTFKYQGTVIGTASGTLQGGQTFTFPGTAISPRPAFFGAVPITVEATVPSDGTIPAHTVTLTANLTAS